MSLSSAAIAELGFSEFPELPRSTLVTDERAGRWLYVVEQTVVVDTTGTEQTFYYATEGFTTKPTDNPANTVILPLLKSAGTFRRDLFSSARVTGPIKPSFGNITLANPARIRGAAGALDTWMDYGIDGGRVTVRRGILGNPYPGDGTFLNGFETVYIAYGYSTISDIELITTKLRDRLKLMDQPVVTEGFTGVGGLEGTGSVAKRKQFVSGDPGFITPILVDYQKQIYYVQSTSTGGAQDLYLQNTGSEVNPFDVFDNGVEITRVQPNYTSAADILANAPAVGTVKYYFGPDCASYPGWKNGGVYFRLGSPPDSDVRVYAYGYPTDADAARYGGPYGSMTSTLLALRAGIGVTDIDASDVGVALGAQLVDDNSSYLDVASDGCLAYQGFFGMTRLDKFRGGYLLDPESNDFWYGTSAQSATAMPTTSRKTFTFEGSGGIVEGTLRREPIPGMEVPIWSVAVSSGKTWPSKLAGGASALLKDYLSRDPWDSSWSGVSDTTRIANPGAEAAVVEVKGRHFQNAISKQHMLERYFVLYGGRREMFTFTVPLTSENLVLELHDVVTLQCPRFRLSAGAKFRIMSITLDCDARQIKFGVWGGPKGTYTGSSSAGDGGDSITTQNPRAVVIPEFTLDGRLSVSLSASAGLQMVQTLDAFTLSARMTERFEDLLIANFEGTNGDTSFTDSSSYARTLTGNSNCALSSTRSPFGTTSLKLSEFQSGGITTATVADLALGGNEPFTMETWIYFVTTAGTTGLLRWVHGSAIDTLLNSGTTAKFQYESSAFGTEEPTPVAYTGNTWVHVAITYDGTNVKRWKNGVLDFTYANTFSSSGTGYLQIGGFDGTLGASDGTEVYMGPTRFSKGCRYTTTFTPPTANF